MSLVRYKFFVISDNIEILYNVQDDSNMVVFDTSTSKITGFNRIQEPFEFLGMSMDELPYKYDDGHYGVNGTVTCFGLEDGIRVTDTGSQGFSHWIYVPESNPLFNLDLTVLIDAISEDHYGIAGRLDAPVLKFIKKPLERKIMTAYRAALRTKT